MTPDCQQVIAWTLHIFWERLTHMPRSRMMNEYFQSIFFFLSWRHLGGGVQDHSHRKLQGTLWKLLSGPLYPSQCNGCIHWINELWGKDKICIITVQILCFNQFAGTNWSILFYYYKMLNTKRYNNLHFNYYTVKWLLFWVKGYYRKTGEV